MIENKKIRMQTKSKKKSAINKITLSPEEINFCHTYVSEDFFGNGVHSYMKAYPGTEYDTARVYSCKMLKRQDINKKILELIDIAGFNDHTIDKALLSLVLQDEEKNVKLGAIKEYNNLKARLEKAKQKALNDGDISKDVLTNYTLIELKQKTNEELNEERKKLLNL